jgi:hypothetical protein
MPFDGTESPRILVLSKLDAAIEFLNDEKRWCKGSLLNLAGQMCLLGALRRAEAEDELKPLILNAAREVTGRRFRSIEKFNDHAKTTHATVLTVLHRTRHGIESGRYAIDRTARYTAVHRLWHGLRARFQPIG